MPCPICGRVMCDHSPAERGQSFSEMRGDFKSDFSTSEKSASEKLGEEFGSLETEVIDASNSGRVSLRISGNDVLAYNIVKFQKGRYQYPKIHQDIMAETPLAEAIRKNGHKFLRLERCYFSYELPNPLRKLFKVKKNTGHVKVADIFVDQRKEDDKYATVIEIYSPQVKMPDGNFEIEEGLIEDTKTILSHCDWKKKRNPS